MNAILLILALALPDDAEALEKFKADIKGKDGAGRSAAVAELAKTKSAKICAKLSSLLMAEVVEVKAAAAAGLGEQEDKKHAIAYLLQGSTGLNAKEPIVMAAIVTALGKLRDEAGAAEVNKNIDNENIDVAKAAVESAGQIRSATSFDPLIKALKECEDVLKPRDKNAAPGGGFGGGRFGGGRFAGNGTNPAATFQEIRARATALKTEIVKVLRDMAKISCEDAKDWEAWWKENRLKWKADKT